MSSGTTSPTPHSLQTALHAATRMQHTNLNKTITARLPLCLPPYSSDPTAYHFGILVFGHIYLTFEQAIDGVLLEDSADETRARHIQLLRTLKTGRLPRTGPLRQDLEVLSKRLQLQHPEYAHIQEEVRAQAEESTQHILENISSRPYLAFAYTWTMYHAMFNGGRWLYKQLAAAGPDFWLETASAGQNGQSIQALSFWRFDTPPHDPHAEELKVEFKGHFEEASQVLTDAERDEVVEEAVRLFELCLRLIDSLDLIIADLHQSTRLGAPEVVDEVEYRTVSGIVTTVWQTFSSSLLHPAYQMLISGWTRSMRKEVTVAD